MSGCAVARRSAGRPMVAGLRAGIVLAAVTLLAGCSTFSTHLTADPLDPGQVDLGLAADVVTMFDVPQQAGGMLPVPVLRARVGLLRNMDLGVLAQLTAVEVSPRIRLVRGATRVAVAPGVGLGRTAEGSLLTEARFIHLYTPVIITRSLASDRRLSFGPRVTHSRYMPRAGGQASGTLVGAFIGLELPTRERYWLSPEFGIHRTVHGDVPVDGLVVHFGLGAGWRSPWRDAARPPSP